MARMRLNGALIGIYCVWYRVETRDRHVLSIRRADLACLGCMLKPCRLGESSQLNLTDLRPVRLSGVQWIGSSENKKAGQQAGSFGLVVLAIDMRSPNHAHLQPTIDIPPRHKRRKFLSLGFYGLRARFGLSLRRKSA